MFYINLTIVHLSISSYRPTYCTVDQDWFLKLANTQQKWCMDKVDFSSSFLASANYRSHVDTDIPDGCVTIHVFKVFLSRLLGRCDQQSDESVQGAGPLLMYNPEVSIDLLLTESSMELKTDTNNELNDTKLKQTYIVISNQCLLK